MPDRSATSSSAIANWRAPQSRRAPIRNRPTSSTSTRAASPWWIAASSVRRSCARPPSSGRSSTPAAQRNLAAGLASSRSITPGFNNWLLFSATVEAALAAMGEPWDAMRIDYAVREHQQWYVGDGVYGDGPQFHLDYYNSFVIQPMLMDVLRTIGAHAHTWERFVPDVTARAKRYAAIQERLIAPDGSYPGGRAFDRIPLRSVPVARADGAARAHAARARRALTAAIHRTLDAPGTFDSDGWLTVGLCGHQPHLGESYISTGSLYLCSTALLPLGLPASDPFWSGPTEMDGTALLARRGRAGGPRALALARA